ncbi:MAG: hypothetical protein Q7S86_04785 [bacterium]|nr:hypothetical protein [bacterium]
MKFFPKIVISFNVGCLVLMFFTALVLPVGVFSDTTSFYRSLGIGSKGVDVLLLQQFLNNDPDTRIAFSGAGSPGFETNHFGVLTRAAVHQFQKKYASEILYVGQASTGYFGPKTIRKINLLLAELQAKGLSPEFSGQGQESATSVQVKPKAVSAIPPKALPPQVFGVSPVRVRAGDKVTVHGTNFSPTGNTVYIRFGQIEGRFDNLPSSDGKMISFTYQPPEVRTMTREEILALPPATLRGILDPVKAVGGSIDDIVLPYRNMKNEEDLKTFLTKNGHSIDELYDKFYVTVENISGEGTSEEVTLSGLRKLSFGLSFSWNDRLLSGVRTFFESFTPKAYAQGTPEGGYNSGIIMQCTCGDGYLTFILDYSSNGGSGLYWFSSSFRPNVGNPRISGPHLGFFQQSAGQCSIEAGPTCVTITANLPQTPWGEAPMGGS